MLKKIEKYSHTDADDKLFDSPEELLEYICMKFVKNGTLQENINIIISLSIDIYNHNNPYYPKLEPLTPYDWNEKIKPYNPPPIDYPIPNPNIGRDLPHKPLDIWCCGNKDVKNENND